MEAELAQMAAYADLISAGYTVAMVDTVPSGDLLGVDIKLDDDFSVERVFKPAMRSLLCALVRNDVSHKLTGVHCGVSEINGENVLSINVGFRKH